VVPYLSYLARTYYLPTYLRYVATLSIIQPLPQLPGRQIATYC
jgi:hypothetical protein